MLLRRSVIMPVCAYVIWYVPTFLRNVSTFRAKPILLPIGVRSKKKTEHIYIICQCTEMYTKHSTPFATFSVLEVSRSYATS